MTPFVGKLDEKLGAILASLDANMVKVGAHDDNLCTVGPVGEQSNGDDSVEGRVPAPGRLLGGLAEPSRLADLAGPGIGPVEDGRELPVRLPLSPPTTNMRPGLAEFGLDVVELRRQTLLETDERALVAGSDEAHLGAHLGTAHVPGLLSQRALILVGGIPNIEADEPHGHGRMLGPDVHLERRPGRDGLLVLRPKVLLLLLLLLGVVRFSHVVLGLVVRRR